MSKKNHYIYKITDKISGEYYIGSRSCDCDPNDDTRYLGSPYTWRPIKKNLIKEIIETNFIDRIDTIKKESQLIKQYIDDPLNRNYYIPTEGFHNYGKSSCFKGKSYEEIFGEIRGKEQREKISKGGKGRYIGPMTDSHKQKIGNANRGRILTDEHREKISKSWKLTGKRPPKNIEKWKENLSISSKGLVKSEIHRQNISNTLKGRLQKRVTCSVCGKEGGLPVMKRYHFNNCKWPKFF